MRLKRVYDVTITLLSPLHIGSGRELQRDFDYVTQGGKTWVVNADALLEHLQRPDGSFDERLVGRPASELLTPGDYFPENRLFRYVLAGQPRAQGLGAVLREQYKDAYNRPYIPGSSLKGALRTVLAWHGFQAQQVELQVGNLGSSRSWAGQPVEREIFGRNPNFDLLRALQVADSESQSADKLRIINAQVITGSEKPGSPIELEAVVQDTEFHTSIVVDEFLHSDLAEAKLQFGRRYEWLGELPEIARHWALGYLTSERDWYRVRKYENIASLYHQMIGILEKGRLSPDQYFLQIGWGGGWQSKTIGRPLQKDAKTWERLLGDKRLSPARFRRKEGDVFPKSRRAVIMQGRPVAPLGWCLVEMKGR